MLKKKHTKIEKDILQMLKASLKKQKSFVLNFSANNKNFRLEKKASQTSLFLENKFLLELTKNNLLKIIDLINFNQQDIKDKYDCIRVKKQREQYFNVWNDSSKTNIK